VSGTREAEGKTDYTNDGYQFKAEPGRNTFVLGHEGREQIGAWMPELARIRFYRLKGFVAMNNKQLGGLLPPDERNLVAQLYSSGELRQMVAHSFEGSGWILVIKPHEGKLEIQKHQEGVAIGLPFHLSADTLQRMTFYTVAMESNRDSILVFEEPEAHAFPYDTKHHRERIALDENKNQYFIATHNPYLLAAIGEKSPPGDGAVFATYYRDYETRVRSLTADEMARLFQSDPFLGVSHLVEDMP
jgi:hypothetical protein